MAIELQYEVWREHSNHSTVSSPTLGTKDIVINKIRSIPAYVAFTFNGEEGTKFCLNKHKIPTVRTVIQEKYLVL
jgi:hypothetical protein